MKSTDARNNVTRIDNAVIVGRRSPNSDTGRIVSINRRHTLQPPTDTADNTPTVEEQKSTDVARTLQEMNEKYLKGKR